jgi:predicted HicB family RNase H-like nuclease
MNTHNYNIVVARKKVDGEWLYEGKVMEFPDVSVFEPSHTAAYEETALVIEDLIELANEMGHEIPQPIESDEEEFSGKMTFRPGRRLHRQIAIEAKKDGQSQNQFLCSLISSALADHGHQKEMEAVATAMNSLQRQIIVYRAGEAFMPPGGMQQNYGDATSISLVVASEIPTSGSLSNQEEMAVPQELLYPR